MKASFYDVKKKEIVETEVTDKKEYTVDGKPRYALKGKLLTGGI